MLAGVTAVLATDQPTPGHVPDPFYPAVGLVSGVALLGLLVAAVTGSRARGRHRGPVHIG